MNEKHQQWLDLYVQIGDATLAYEQVYGPGEKNSIAVGASRLKARYAEEIDKLVLASYKQDTPIARNVINDLMLNSKNEMVKFKAAQDVLARAGHDAAHIVEHRNPEQTKEELEARLKAVLTGLNQEDLQQLLGDKLNLLLQIADGGLHEKPDNPTKPVLN